MKFSEKYSAIKVLSESNSLFFLDDGIQLITAVQKNEAKSTEQ